MWRAVKLVVKHLHIEQTSTNVDEHTHEQHISLASISCNAYPAGKQGGRLSNNTSTK
ncbi:MAG: hypothetical protein RSH25_16120 [Bacteroides sp.]|uniref:hypothetical protein n=1 Tax=Bacteroides sp. TaxID=29523 RepID=UPI002FC8B8D8